MTAISPSQFDEANFGIAHSVAHSWHGEAFPLAILPYVTILDAMMDDVGSSPMLALAKVLTTREPLTDEDRIMFAAAAIEIRRRG